ncbi:putative UPF0481 protein [Spatholobus suberectus]|nr:putative UPF0481 protein [Spatholobus suberectus]
MVSKCCCGCVAFSLNPYIADMWTMRLSGCNCGRDAVAVSLKTFPLRSAIAVRTAHLETMLSIKTNKHEWPNRGKRLSNDGDCSNHSKFFIYYHLPIDGQSLRGVNMSQEPVGDKLANILHNIAYTLGKAKSHMASLTIFNSESDEDTWVIQINQLVSETNLSILNKMPVCIYHVPKSLSCTKPEAFAPQLIAIGPYTHFRPELYPMERFKVFAAKRVLDHFNKHDLKQLVEQLRNTGPFVRACYHKYLDLKEDTLLYTMAIDSLFLLYFFHNYVDKKVSGSFMTGLEDQVQISGVKLTKDAIIRDIIMVENQIPTYMLLRILVLESPKTVDSVQEYLGSMLLSFCEKHSPLKLTHIPTSPEAVTKHYHVLDLMYHW